MLPATALPASVGKFVDDAGGKALREHESHLLQNEPGAVLEIAAKVEVSLPTAQLASESTKTILKLEE